MGNWWRECVASTLHSTSKHGVSSITTADAHTSAASSRLNWCHPADLVGSQYSSHYLGTWCIQHYYRWCAHLGCQQSTELTPPGRFKWTRPFRRKTKSWFLRVCHHISNAVYLNQISVVYEENQDLGLSDVTFVSFYCVPVYVIKVLLIGAIRYGVGVASGVGTVISRKKIGFM
jgi:hypothetical protein